ncbi:hypothetical protein CHS0354_014921 [Potamilus streckersoni]|uniref:Uncharacterized protein n=1 Tax=Potamilus streckersoni TaxID=2493646 RepID=A0AAE0TAS6_9BIVA|nr:hypothetical protein CHS0354_014921 [Potamilus streckersoni]
MVTFWGDRRLCETTSSITYTGGTEGLARQHHQLPILEGDRGVGETTSSITYTGGGTERLVRQHHQLPILEGDRGVGKTTSSITYTIGGTEGLVRQHHQLPILGGQRGWQDNIINYLYWGDRGVATRKQRGEPIANNIRRQRIVCSDQYLSYYYRARCYSDQRSLIYEPDPPLQPTSYHVRYCE